MATTNIINTITYTSRVLDSDDRLIREERTARVLADRKLTCRQAERQVRKMDSTAIVTRIESATAA